MTYEPWHECFYSLRVLVRSSFNIRLPSLSVCVLCYIPDTISGRIHNTLLNHFRVWVWILTRLPPPLHSTFNSTVIRHYVLHSKSIHSSLTSPISFRRSFFSVTFASVWRYRTLFNGHETHRPSSSVSDEFVSTCLGLFPCPSFCSWLYRAWEPTCLSSDEVHQVHRSSLRTPEEPDDRQGSVFRWIEMDKYNKVHSPYRTCVLWILRSKPLVPRTASQPTDHSRDQEVGLFQATNIFILLHHPLPKQYSYNSWVSLV